jgi:hypothetical protein
LPSRPRFPHALLRSLPSLLRSVQARVRSLRWEPMLRDARRAARRPSGLTLGAAFGTVAVAGVVLAAVSAGSPAPAASVADQDGAGQVWPAEASGHGGPALPGHAGRTTGAAAVAGVAPHAAAPRTVAPHQAVARLAAPHKAAGHEAAPRQAAGHKAAAPKAAGHKAAPHKAAGHKAAPHKAAGHLKAAAAPARPYLIYDSVTPRSIPSGQQVVATYGDGPHPVSPSTVTGRKTVMWISITGRDYDASVVDVEPGNATPAEAASWAWHRLRSSPDAVARIYTMIREWPYVRAAVASFPAQMRARIHWWIADPTGYPHLVPGSDATQWYWGSHYDISTASPGF